MASESLPARPGNIESSIFSLRGQRVILDTDLALLYGVPTKALNQAVKRNQDRFPREFAFQLTRDEVKLLRSQIVTLTSRHFRYLPHAFTEHGALMAANVLHSPLAVKMSVAIVQAFVRLRQLALSMEQLTRKVNALEESLEEHDSHFEVVFKAIRKLMAPPEPSRRRIGFH